jgi:hypothetical protein
MSMPKNEHEIDQLFGQGKYTACENKKLETQATRKRS